MPWHVLTTHSETPDSHFDWLTQLALRQHPAFREQHRAVMKGMRTIACRG
jgi:hypothetical protein